LKCFFHGSSYRSTTANVSTLQSKRLTRRLERASAAASRLTVAFPADAAAAAAKATTAKKAWYQQRREYRQLRHRKSFEFWRSKLEADQSDPGKLWRSVDVLLGRGRIPATQPFFSLTRLKKCGPTLKMHHHLHLAVCVLVYVYSFLAADDRRNYHCRSTTARQVIGC